MALQTMIAQLAEARAAYKSKLVELGRDAQKAIGEFLGPLIPDGFAVQWYQYTPYFNDGEPCTFRVGDGYLVKLDPAGDRNDIGRHPEAEAYHVYLTTYQVKTFEGISAEDMLTIAKAWQTIASDDDLFQQAFGDHVNIRVFSDGTSATTDYDHE